MKHIERIKFLFFLCLAVFIFASLGCGGETASNAGAAKGPEPKVLAKIGDQTITNDDLEAALQRIPERKRAALRDTILDNLIEAKVFAAEARAAQLDKDGRAQKAVEKATKEILATYFIKRRLDPQAEPSEEVIRKFYLEHQDQFVVPEAVRLQQILVNDEQKAREILQSLKEGASFETLAKEVSIASFGKERGEPGWLFKGQMDPELEKVAFSLEKDVASDVIKTKQGYQIIRLLDKQDQKQFSFEEAKSRIRTRLFWKNKQEIIEKYYEAARVNTHPTEAGVLAKVGEEAFTEEELSPILASIPEDKKEKAKLRWIDYFIETTVFSKEAKKAELGKDPEVARELRRKTDQVLANVFRGDLMAEKIQLTDSDIDRYYESHPEKFTTPPKVRAKSILVKTEKEAEEILQELKDGASFGYLAQNKSLRPNAARRAGEIGWFAKGQKDPAIEKVAFSLEKGQISDVIETSAGYEIIKVMDKKGGEIRPLEAVRPQIKMTLTMEKFEQEKQLHYKKAGVKLMGA